MSAPSRASCVAIDRERVRKVYADNIDVPHALLAKRFGISVVRFREIVGLHGRGAVSEFLHSGDVKRFTPNMRSPLSRNGFRSAARRARRGTP